MRYGSLSPKKKEDIKGTRILLPGFGGTIEKYFETMREFVDKGYNVWIMDWRGQGGSERYLQNEPHKAHSEGFDAQLRDLDHFVNKVVKTEKDKPFILSGHSMGAHLSLRYLKEHSGVFDCAVINAPMLDINTGSIPKYIARMLAKHAGKIGGSEKYVVGNEGWFDKTFEENNTTSSPERFELIREIFRNNPKLQLGGPTYNWVNEAYKSMDILSDESFLKSIDTPILMGTPTLDEIVEIDAQYRAAKLLPKCEHFIIEGARHEIWMESDHLRDPWIKKDNDFVETFVQKKKLSREFDSGSRKNNNKTKGVKASKVTPKNKKTNSPRKK